MKHKGKQHSRFAGFASVTVLSCPVKCCSGWEANQIKFLIKTTFAIPQSFKDCGCFSVFRHICLRVCCARVCIHLSSVAWSWECCQSSVDRPRTQHAYKCGPSARLLRRFQFANLDRLVSAALIVLPFVKKENVRQHIYAQGSNRPSRPRQPPQP